MISNNSSTLASMLFLLLFVIVVIIVVVVVLFRRSEGPDEPVPVLSVPDRRNVRLRLHSGQLLLSGPSLQAGPGDLVEVDSSKLRYWSVRGFTPVFRQSDHDHLRGEVRVRFSAPPSDVVDQNLHDGCYHLHRHSHDTGHLYDLSSQGINSFALVLD